jgi:hypothetical protein
MEFVSMRMSPWAASADITDHNCLSSSRDAGFSHDPACQTAASFSMPTMPPGRFVSALVRFSTPGDSIQVANHAIMC